MSGCEAAPAPPHLLTETRIEQPQLPADLLACEDAPAPPDDTATQRAVAGYLAELWSAFEDCRAKLAGVAKLLAEEGK